MRNLIPDRERLVSTARHAAVTCETREPYLPDQERADDFYPHEWVLEAMAMAERYGRLKGYEDAGRKLVRLLQEEGL